MTNDTALTLRLPSSLIAALDEQRAAMRPIPSRAELVRLLLVQNLTNKETKQ